MSKDTTMTSAPTNMPPILNEKRSVRATVRREIEAMAPAQRHSQSTTICETVRTMPSWESAKRVLVYSPIEQAKNVTPEVDISPLLHAAWANGRVVCLPTMDWENNTMVAAAVNGPNHAMEIRQHSIPEPVDAEVIEAVTLDVVIVPGLAFDREGYRLGRGAGFYDRFLTSILRTPSMKKPMLIGVGFDCQLIDRVPREPHDVLLDAVVTPAEGVIRAALS